MKSIILFGSKHGTTQVCVEKLKGFLKEEVDIVNLEKDEDVTLDKYDKIIIGSPIYAGAFNQSVKEFLTSHKDELVNKKVGLFVCCMSDEEKVKEDFKQNIPEEVLQSAVAKSNFGGAFMFSKMNFFERQIIKMIAKKDPTLGKVDGKSDILRINEEEIKNFAVIMEG